MVTKRAQIAAIQLVGNTLGSDYDIRRTEFVGPTVGAELAEKGILAVVCALLAIMVYIWFRFEWQFSIAAILALTHDVLSTIGLFALTNFEFNLATVAAILTIAGYSINDTVVVFDRVRENLRRYKSYSLGDILNKSLNETLSRTVMTSVTTLLALTAIVIFGGAVLRDFAIAMIWGVLIGTYSSVFVAVGLLSRFDIKRAAMTMTITVLKSLNMKEPKTPSPKQPSLTSPSDASSDLVDIRSFEGANDLQLIHGYGGNRFRISGERYSGSVLVYPRQTAIWTPPAETRNIDD